MIDYAIIHSNRKTVSIQIKNGKVEVKAPLKFPKQNIDEFVESKANWINEHLAESIEKKKKRSGFTLNYGDKILYQGIECPIVARDGNVVGFDRELLQFYMPGNLTSEEIKLACVQIYKLVAKRVCTEKVLYFAKQMNVMPSAVKINSAKGRWGSCSNRKSLNFSWRLVLADSDVIDYVVVHELSHTVEMNHSDRFWMIVESVLPDYQERQTRLKAVSARLSEEDWEYNPDNDYHVAENEIDNIKLRFHYAEYKTVLSAKNGINLYRGCTHDCIYCDSRSQCYQMNHDFDDIEVKENAVQILERQLMKRRNPCMIGTGSMCDPYIHLEEELQLTRQCLEAIERQGFGVSVLTKSARILRDIDILRRINEKTKCVVQMTMTTYNDALCRIVEPNVSVTSERFDVLMKMKDAGIPTVVWLCPILPFINDTEENLRGLLDYCIRADVKAVMFFGCGVTLREGNRDYFYGKLDEHFPDMKERYIRTFGNSYECTSPNAQRLYSVFKELCHKHDIIYKPNDVFGYLAEFESKMEKRQLSLFDV